MTIPPAPEKSIFVKGRLPGLPSANLSDNFLGLRPAPFLAPPCGILHILSRFSWKPQLIKNNMRLFHASCLYTKIFVGLLARFFEYRGREPEISPRCAGFAEPMPPMPPESPPADLDFRIRAENLPRCPRFYPRCRRRSPFRPSSAPAFLRYAPKIYKKFSFSGQKSLYKS